MQGIAQLVGLILGSIIGLIIWIVRKLVAHGAKSSYNAIKQHNQKKNGDKS